jgi:hypothetical protein
VAAAAIFGVVTRFELALHPVGRQITAGLIVYPFDQARSVFQQYRDTVASMTPDLTVWAVLRKAPPLPFLAPQVHGQDVLVLPVFSPSPSDAVDAAIARMTKLGETLGMHVGPCPIRPGNGSSIRC